MSRIIVKGFPPQVTEEELRNFFTTGSECQVTDVRIVRKKDGTSRQMGFVGFKRLEDGDWARQRYQGSFLAGAKITIAAAVQPAATTERPAKRQRTASPVADPTQHALRATDATDAEITDADYLAKRMKRSIGTSQRLSPDADAVTKAAVEIHSQQSNRLFLRNLSYSITTADIVEHFSTIDPACKVHLPTQPDSNQSTGIAFITCSSSDKAAEARERLDKSVILGRLLHVLPAAEQADRHGTQSSRSTDAIQSNPRPRQGQGHQTHSALVMDQNAVLSTVAHRMNIHKSDIIDATSSDSAVRMALAETQLLAEAREYFARQGITLQALETPQARSRDTLFVKNIPANTSASALQSLFERHGKVDRVVTSPSATIAFVRMSDLTSCQAALRNLAYQKLGSGILYVEKAPQDIWRSESLPLSQLNTTETETSPTNDRATGKTLYVKNLAFNTSQADFARLFNSLPGCSFARLTTRVDQARPGTTLSAGYGFIGFATEEDAANAIQRMTGHLIDGHAIQLSYANQGHNVLASEDSASRVQNQSSTSTKVTVKNLPFETTKKDVRQLFSPYGLVKSVRVPLSVDGRSRGFGFVEFATKRDASAAMDALRHTHLLGRHLILQYERSEQGSSQS